MTSPSEHCNRTATPVDNEMTSPMSATDYDEGLVPSGTVTAVPSVKNVSRDSKAKSSNLFEKEDSFPLAEGYRQIGVSFEDLTVYGADAGMQHVESLEVALLKVGLSLKVDSLACRLTDSIEQHSRSIFLAS
jgi:hypothetical protein